MNDETFWRKLDDFMRYEQERVDDLQVEELIKDVDVLGNPGVFWTIVGAASLLSLFAIKILWRLVQRR